jgi:CheY-like chemotaxis protein/HPt (histidine-containing phosphotransfer) domain-containing protein
LLISVPTMSDKTAVLLVDDQRFIGLAVQRLIASESDLQLHCCEIARDAVTRANEIKPAIIFQDLVMPDIDGLTLVGLYRTNHVTAHTPIVVLSGNEDASSREKSIAAGANDYVLKLPPQAELVACIRRHLAAMTVTAGLKPHATDLPAGAAPQVSITRSAETLDRQVLATFCEPGGQLSSFGRMLVGQFLEDAASQVSALMDAVRRQDRDALKMKSHSLKGSALTVGAMQLGGLCRELEQQVDRQPDRLVSPALVAAIEDEFILVRKAMEQL